MSALSSAIATARSIEPRCISGTVTAVRGATAWVRDLPLPVGATVRVALKSRGQKSVLPSTTIHNRGEVIGFNPAAGSIIMLYSSLEGIGPGTAVSGEAMAQVIGVGPEMLGRVVNGLGHPIDAGPPLRDVQPRPIHSPAPDSLDRARITDVLPTGIRAIDAFVPLGIGQRMGVFSAAGVGKSTLLGTIARGADADVNVIALIGERGREVREFIEEALGESGLARSVVVVATSDESPLLRVRAAHAAAAIAEFFRDRGDNVLLMMDSITRFAQAQRQIGLAIGEQPATRGYPPSVFASLPALLERAGPLDSGGSITGLYAVLVEGDDMNEPISDAARGILDGHITLSRRLATQGHYPAIEVLDSISRVTERVADRHHLHSRSQLIRLMAAYREMEELINVGAYVRGSNPECDAAIAMRNHLREYLQQGSDDAEAYPMTLRRLHELAGEAERALASAEGAAATAVAKARMQKGNGGA
ncbi:MAG: FliI/YscN family ATPase [Phycisphaerales bacterium]